MSLNTFRDLWGGGGHFGHFRSEWLSRSQWPLAKRKYSQRGVSESYLDSMLENVSKLCLNLWLLINDISFTEPIEAIENLGWFLK